MGLLIRIIIILFLCGQAFAADYYVSPSGSGSTCSKVSPCAPSGVPWTTVDDETSTVYLMGGTYTTSLDITHTTAANTLNIKPCSASPDPSGCDSQVLFQLSATGDTVMWLGSPSNVIIDGSTTTSDHTINLKLNIGNNYGIAMNTGRSGNKIRYVEFTGMSGSHYCIDAALQTDFEVDHNYFHDNVGTSEMNISGASGSTYGAVLIHHNTVIAPTVNVITGGGRGVDIYNNSFDVSNAASTYDNIHILNDGIQYLRIYNNEFINTGLLEDQTIFLENSTTTGNKTQHVRIYNNIFRESPTNTGGHYSIGIAIETADSTGGVDDFYIVNNSFISTTGYFYPIRMYGSSSHVATYTNFIVKNNIFKGAEKHIILSYVTWANEADAINNYNIFYHASSNQFSWLTGGGGDIATYTTVCSSGCTWATNHPTYLNNFPSDPVFTSSTDLTLQESSPAINTGENLSSLTNMDAGWPTDKNGTARAVPWEIGAYEYSGGGAPPNYTVTVSKDGAGCTLSAEGGYEVPSGESLNVYLTLQSTGWQAYGAGWGGTCPATGSDPRVATPTADCTVTYTCIPIRVMPWIR